MVNVCGWERAVANWRVRMVGTICWFCSSRIAMLRWCLNRGIVKNELSITSWYRNRSSAFLDMILTIRRWFIFYISHMWPSILRFFGLSSLCDRDIQNLPESLRWNYSPAPADNGVSFICQVSQTSVLECPITLSYWRIVEINLTTRCYKHYPWISIDFGSI